MFLSCAPGKRRVRFPSGEEKLHCSVPDNRERIAKGMCITPGRRQPYRNYVRRVRCRRFFKRRKLVALKKCRKQNTASKIKDEFLRQSEFRIERIFVISRQMLRIIYPDCVTLELYLYIEKIAEIFCKLSTEFCTYFFINVRIP